VIAAIASYTSSIHRVRLRSQVAGGNILSAKSVGPASQADPDDRAFWQAPQPALREWSKSPRSGPNHANLAAGLRFTGILLRFLARQSSGVFLSPSCLVESGRHGGLLQRGSAAGRLRFRCYR